MRSEDGNCISITNGSAAAQEGAASQPFRVRLPGFIIDEEIGLGDVIKQVSYRMGIKPCGGCEKRADALNRGIVFTPRS